jgi:outer membrane protein OmpA-like peptidoglycan-associated protein
MKKTFILSTVILAAWTWTSTGAGQTPPRSYHFDLQTFHGAVTSGGLFSVEGTEIGSHLRPRGGVQLSYAHDPLVYEGFGDHEISAVGSRLNAEVQLGLGLFNRVELGLALPVVLFQVGEASTVNAQPQQTGIGDLRLTPKVRLFGNGIQGLSLSVLAGVRFPTAGEASLAGQGWGAEGQAVVGFRRGALSVHGSAGYRFQAEERRLFDLVVDDQLLAGVGARYRLGSFAVMAEVNAATAAASPFSDSQQTPVLAMLGGSYTRSGFTVSVGGGPGIVPGFGSPAARFLVSVGYAPWGIDSDGDRVPDSDDGCPLVPEDRDGFSDTDGCPDPDNDRDGILDQADRCPNEPEDRDKFEDADGCPDPDNDKDGILDKDDRCPNEPEDKDGFADHDGCVDPDNDKDGILDPDDKCPNQPEVVNGIDDEDGCPEADRDADGILDKDDKCPDVPEDKNGIEDEDGCPDDPDKDKIPSSRDRCPTEPETYNGYQDKDGCPDSKTPQVVIKRDFIWTSEAIYFPSDKWTIKGRFRRLLNQMALLINKKRRIKVVYVEGHADERGSEKYNQWLSFYRAKEVVRYLRRQGVARTRLRALGWGENRPWDSNSTNTGQARNRRVLFHVIYRVPRVRMGGGR